MCPAETRAASSGPTQAERPRRNGELLASVCHDLKAPLASIVMGAGFLQRVLPSDQATAVRVADAIRRAAERMDHLIVSFADLARLDMHELALEVRGHVVGPIVREVVDESSPQAAAENIPLSLQLAPDVASVLVACDRARLSQILRQLLACALRVSPDGGQVELRVVAGAPGSIRFEVEAIRSPSSGSRALGTELPKPQLAIANGLVELHGGHLAIISSRNGHAMSFSLARAEAEPS